MTTEEKRRVTVALSQDLYDELVTIAKGEARTITSLVTFILLQFLEEHKNKSDLDT